MEGAIRIVKRFIGATMLISAFLLAFNFVLLSVWIFKGMDKGSSPASVVQTVAENLHRTSAEHSSGDYMLNASATDLLEQNRAWAMLINQEGQVVWAYSLPDELPRTYGLTDVAKFTQSYLLDYPVFVWEHQDGLVVVGYPKDSLAKYHHILPARWVSSLPERIVGLLLINLGLALLLSLLIGFRLIRSIRPLTQGIQALGEDREVYVEPKGFLADLAQSVNRASTLLQQKNESLKKRDEARSNWIAGISHDIRTPLSMVLGYASDLEENANLPSESRKQAGIIRKQAENLRSLISDLNLVSMLEYEMQPLHKKPLRLSALARELATEFLNNGLDERYSIEVEIGDESIQVFGDERLLKRALTNLIQNSIEHNPEGCTITLKTALDQARQTGRFIVEDNGKGIPQHLIPELLDLPYSSQRKRSSLHGRGLGLPMVARIAKAHQGQLILSSASGKGLRAELVLPIIKQQTNNKPQIGV